MSKKRIRAHAAYYSDASTLYTDRLQGVLGQKFHVLPATAEAYEQMVEQMDSAITSAMNKWLAGGGPKACQDAPRAALRAIGITPLKKGRT